jgi:hypothetical protein
VFASKECRIAYHNDLSNAFRNKMSKINKELLTDYKVVDTILGDYVDITVNKHFLSGAGFSSRKFTHVINIGDETVFCLYDISFQRLSNEDYYIKRLK